MTKVVHKIDPNPDTIIILKNPLVNVDFAIWNDSNAKNVDAKNSIPQETTAKETTIEEPVGEPDEPGNSNHKVIHYHVSSRHLKLGSCHFERMLSGGTWKEGIPDETDGRYYITIEDWDEDALLILLNVFHLRNRKVPRSLSLIMLAKIAMLVEYYDCAEAVELSTEIWINCLKKDNNEHIPKVPCQDLMLWMYISWVFRLSEVFTQTTAIMIKQSKQNELYISDLPIARFIGRSAIWSLW